MQFRLNLVFKVAMPWLRGIVVGLSPRRPPFGHRSLHMRFVVEIVALRQVLQFSPVSIVPPMLHNHIHCNAICIRRTEEWSLGAFKPSSAL